MKNAIFIHAAILDKCKERVLQYLECIANSKIEAVIYLCFIGSDPIPIERNYILNHNNFEIIKLSNNLADYELPTLNFLYAFSLANPTYNILYLHTKNVGKKINLCIEDQIEYMLYFLVTKWETCIKMLDTCDSCGVDLRNQPTLHYSGNFWWSRASNIITLPSPIEFNNLVKYPNPLKSLRHNQEFWICFNRNKKHFSMWDCNINVYERHIHRYPKDLYFGL